MSTSADKPCSEFRSWNRDKHEHLCGTCGWEKEPHELGRKEAVITTNGTDKPVALKPKRKFNLGWIGKKPVEITEHDGRVNGAETQVIRIDADKKDEPRRATVKVTNKYDPNKCANTRAKERRRKQMARDRWNNGEVYSVGTLTMHP